MTTCKLPFLGTTLRLYEYTMHFIHSIRILEYKSDLVLIIDFNDS